MPRTVRVKVEPPKERIDYEDMLIEFDWGGYLSIGFVTNTPRFGLVVKVLATDYPKVSHDYATVDYKDYRNISRDDLPLYLNLRYKTELFEQILQQEEQS